MISSKDGIIGLAIGDAMGVPLEFYPREKLLENMTVEMKGYGSHNVPKGSWSDDTSMTICLIDAINKTGEIVPKDICDNFVRWLEDEEFTPTGITFDVGRTCWASILEYQRKPENPESCGQTGEVNQGNGSLMRISPLIYYCFAKNMDEKEIYTTVKLVSSLTHRREECIMGCYIYVLYGIELLKGFNIFDAYYNLKEKDYSMFSQSTQRKYDRVLKEKLDYLNMGDIKSSGYVVDTLEASIWCILVTDSFDEAIIKAINLGEDTDTIGACTGALAGIYYGLEDVDREWKDDLIRMDYLESICEKFDEILNKGKGQDE